MKVPVWFLNTLLGACVLLEAWTLNRLDNLTADVAAIKAVLHVETIAKIK